jgi:hypothetical protein
MVLCEWDAPEGDPGQSCVHLFARILSASFNSVSIFSVCCYSRVSISMHTTNNQHHRGKDPEIMPRKQACEVHRIHDVHNVEHMRRETADK